MIFLFILIYLFPRLLFAFRFPIFNDEAIMIHFGRFVIRFPEHIMTFTVDGRQPAFVTTVGLFQFPNIDPLITTRLMTIGFGLIGFIALLGIARKLGLSSFGQKLLTVAVATSPFLVLYDTLVLPDVQVTAATVASAYILLYGIEKPSIARGILLGLVVGLGWWYFSLVLLIIPGLVFFYIVAIPWKKTMVRSSIAFWAASLGMFLFLTLPVYINHPTLTLPVKRTLDIGELLRFPWQIWLANTIKISQWFMAFVPAPLLFFSVLGLRHDPKKLWRGLAICTFLPIIIIIFISTAFSARNTIFVVPTLLLLSVRGVLFVPYKKLMSLLCIAVSTVSTCILIYSPLQYYPALSILPDAHSDFSQYVTSWSSGYGVREAADWLLKQSRHEDLIVVVRNDSGNPEDGMFAYLEPKNVPVIYPDQLKFVKQYYQSRTYYFVSRGAQYGEFGPYLKEVARFKKPLDSEFVGIFKIIQ